MRIELVLIDDYDEHARVEVQADATREDFAEIQDAIVNNLELSAEPEPVGTTPTPVPVLWQLTHVEDVEHTQDDSGVYVYINWVMPDNEARLDIMSESNSEPLASFQGCADNVRKHVMRWFENRAGDGGPVGPISLEHAAYIGAELERADTERIDYVQG